MNNSHHVDLWSLVSSTDAKKYDIVISREKDSVNVTIYKKTRPIKLFGVEIIKRVHTTKMVLLKDNIKVEISRAVDKAFAKDVSVDCLSYMAYAEKGFNDNRVNVLGPLKGIKIPDDVKDKMMEFNFRLNLLHCAVGLADEVGEVLDHIKKYVFYDKPIKTHKVVAELGDCEWYKFNMMRLLHIAFSDVLEGNRIKLDKRWPDGRHDTNMLKDEDSEDELIKEALFKEK